MNIHKCSVNHAMTIDFKHSDLVG